MPLPRRAIRWLALGMAATLGLTACGGFATSKGSTDASATVSQADIDKAMQTPTELTFWTWVPDIAEGGRALREEVPGDQGQGGQRRPGPAAVHQAAHRAKAGTGAPDVAQIEFQYIPTFTITDSLLDLRPYGAAALKDKFVDWTWGQVSGPDGEVWAIPQDTGPMGMLYRQDIFDKHGIDVAEDLGRVRRRGPQAARRRPEAST